MSDIPRARDIIKLCLRTDDIVFIKKQLAILDAMLRREPAVRRAPTRIKNIEITNEDKQQVIELAAANPTMPMAEIATRVWGAPSAVGRVSEILNGRR
jgi:hypothetical protein